MAPPSPTPPVPAAAESQAAGAAFAELCDTLIRLRAPGGCAWDRAQTLESLRACLIEEAYEVIEASESGPPAAHRDELGDLLLQVVFQAAIARDAGHFGVGEVVGAIVDKLKRRHPHVFGDAQAVDADSALRQWEGVKAAERGAGGQRLAGVPRRLPALLRAQRVLEKAAAAGFAWPDAAAGAAKVEEEWAEYGAASAQGERAAMQEEMGDVLLSLVGLCQVQGLDAEACLGAATHKLMQRFGHIEASVGSAALPQLAAAEWEAHWQAAKRALGPLTAAAPAATAPTSSTAKP